MEIILSEVVTALTGLVVVLATISVNELVPILHNDV